MSLLFSFICEDIFSACGCINPSFFDPSCNGPEQDVPRPPRDEPRGHPHADTEVLRGRRRPGHRRDRFPGQARRREAAPLLPGALHRLRPRQGQEGPGRPQQGRRAVRGRRLRTAQGAVPQVQAQGRGGGRRLLGAGPRAQRPGQADADQ